MKRLFIICCFCIGVAIESVFVNEIKRAIIFLIISVICSIAISLKNN
jgi:hypothetical protein